VDLDADPAVVAAEVMSRLDLPNARRRVSIRVEVTV
jgi:hypothetical protein